MHILYYGKMTGKFPMNINLTSNIITIWLIIRNDIVKRPKNISTHDRSEIGYLYVGATE